MPAATDILRKAFSLARGIPFLSVVILAVAFQVTKEFYPFSHFPMFSVLTPTVEFYYLTDAKQTPIPQKTYFGFSTSWTRKMLNTRLTKLSGGDNVDSASPEEMRAAGQETLDYLMDHCEDEHKAQVEAGGLQLHQIFIKNTGGQLLRRDTLIAEIPPRP